MKSIIFKFGTVLGGVLLCAAAQAATVNTTLTVNATGPIGATITATGTANLTGIGNNLPFTATLNLSPDSSGNLNAPFAITISGDKLNGTLTIPGAALTSSQATAKATITGGTGAYAGATGSFPSLPGSYALTATGFAVNFTGAGTITTGGSGGGGGGSTPTITQVGDAAAYTNNVAPGGIFYIKGSGLAPSGLTAFSTPRPTVSPSSNVKVTFTPAGGGSGTDAYLWYIYDQSGTSQIAGILPSTVAPGAYTVTVTYGSAVSAPFATQVVANKLTLFTQDSSGSGLTSMHDFISASRVDLNRLTSGTLSDGTTYAPAHPGQAVIAYGTGLGAYAAGDNDPSKALHDYRSSSMQISAIVGGVTIPVDYAGLAGYPGEDQINFTLPDSVPTGCAVTLQFSVNGQLTPPTSISIAPDKTSNACVLPGYTASQLQKLDQGGTITSGGFSITQFAISDPTIGQVKSNSIGGDFTQISAFQLSAAMQGNVSFLQQGSCTLVQTTTTGQATPPSPNITYLDAGSLTVTGPASSSLNATTLTKRSITDPTTNKLIITYGLSSFEGVSVPGQTNFSLPAGTYTINGSGGADVGAFTASISIGTPLLITGGLPSTVTRNAGLTLDWTGGNATDQVEIIGGTSIQTGSGTSAVTTTTEFICLTTADKRTFTVPASILNQVPANTGANDSGFLDVGSGAVATFTAPLKAGGNIDSGIFANFSGTGATTKFQ